MGESSIAEARRRVIPRPLVGLLTACLLGGWLARLPAPWGSTALGLGLLGMLLGRGRTPGLGLSWSALLLFGILGGLRAQVQGGPAHSEGPGVWRTEYEGDELVGHLEGRAQRYELPRGSVREGELVALNPSREPGRLARGPIRPAGNGGASPPLSVYADEIQRLAAPRRGLVVPGRAAWRQLRGRVMDRLELIKDVPVRGLALALLFGDRRELTRERTDLYTRTGTRHILAVSGLHVGLVAALWIWPLGRLIASCLCRIPLLPARLRRCLRAEAIRIVLLLVFIPFAGAGAPVVRAALALGLTQAAALLPGRGALRWERQPDTLSLWAFAALLEWMNDPSATNSISMQLSYVATLDLFLLGTCPAPVVARCDSHGALRLGRWARNRGGRAGARRRNVAF